MAGGVVRLAVAVEGGHILVAWALGWLVGHPPFEHVRLNWPALIWGAVATCPPLLAVWFCSRSSWEPLVRLMQEVNGKLVPAFARCTIFELVLISFLAGVGEEALFRGVIQSVLAGWFNPWLALLLTSGLFGLGHLITPAYAVIAGLLGFYLGVIALAYGNLLVVMIAHGLYDLIALVYLTGSQGEQGTGAGQQAVAGER